MWIHIRNNKFGEKIINEANNYHGMSTQYDAVCENYRNDNGRRHLRFKVEAPSDMPTTFSIQPSNDQFKRLMKYSDKQRVPQQEVGWVPVVYNNGWEIDWNSLSAYSYD
jgi:hypothetical protein